MKITTQKQGLSGNQLKLIAIVAMTIDHLAWTIFPGYPTTWYSYTCHIIGRLTAPIMWFFIAEGSFYTHDRKRYILRLFLFAIVSHFAYAFCFGISPIPWQDGLFNQTSIMWPLVLAVLLIDIEQNEKIPLWLRLLVIPIACILAFPSDWSATPVMASLFLYYHRGNFRRQSLDIVFWTAVYAAAYMLFIDRPYGLVQLCTCLSLPLLKQYNGTRGKGNCMKWLFYIYYPAHLILIGFLRILLNT
jgi:hypothetical protein